MSHDSPVPAELSQTACDQCHRCKLRCTRELPYCQRCLKIGSACTFSTGKPIGKPRGSKNRTSKRKTQASEGDEDHKYECPPGERSAQTKGRDGGVELMCWSAVSSPVAIGESWKDFQLQPLFPTTLGSADGDAPMPSPATNGFFIDDGSMTASHLTTDIRRHDAKSYSSPNTASSGTGSSHDTNAVIPWPGSAGSDRCDSLPLGDPMDVLGVSGTVNLQSPYASHRASRVAVDQLTIHESLPDATTCLCDPTSLRVVESFQRAQLRPADDSLDQSLLLLRSGGSSTLASLLLLQRAMRCYSSLLAAATGGSNGSQNLSGVAIGGFQVDDTLHSQVVVAVVKTEMKRGINVLMAFETATQTNKSSSRVLQGINLLSRGLREEFTL